MATDLKFHTVQEVAEALNCTERHIYGLIEEGAFDGAVNLGTERRAAYRISDKALNAFIQARTVQPAAATAAA